MTALYPWQTYEDLWELDISQVEIDGEPVPEAVDIERNSIRAPHSEWSIITVHLNCSIPSLHLFPVEQAHLIVADPPTMFRQRFKMEPNGDGSFSVTITLFQEVLAKVATLMVEISTVINGRVRSVGRSNEWRLIVDGGTPPPIPGTPPLEFRWVDFSSDLAPEFAKAHPEATMVLQWGMPPFCLSQRRHSRIATTLVRKYRAQRKTSLP